MPVFIYSWIAIGVWMGLSLHEERIHQTFDTVPKIIMSVGWPMFVGVELVRYVGADDLPAALSDRATP